ncbi:RDD family protein [Brachybacterium sp. AOP43-C2-M15]|uniref:RDD family protein n=1 Tax=Brachybacterium sp. AOP43-C2-M15 TaxID=3457661 RepID=UPI004034EBB5
MNQTRYCSTCGTLLSEGAAVCGECGARYQASPYERRATDAPGAWSQAPKPRSRDLGGGEQAPAEDEGIELITRESLEPERPGATTLRSQDQYDQMMVTQPPMNQYGQGSASGMPSAPGSPAPASGPAPSGSGPTSSPPTGAGPAGAPLDPPLDGCVPAPLLKRFLAALVDSVLATLVLVPLMIGGSLVLFSESIGVVTQILVGVGTALPVAYSILMIWLTGAKGFTLGKLILGLRVTRASQGGPIGFLRALGRWFLYGIIPLIMALSIFLDPRKHLRGFHDRAIDSVVADAKAGRNPMLPRPDDFERESAEHYLGAPSVAVSTHENLLSEPGAAWAGEAGSAPAQPASSGAWGQEQQVAPSPYAPSAPSGSAAPAAEDAGGAWSPPPAASPPVAQPPVSQPPAGGWAPPPVEPMPDRQQGWDDQGRQAPQQPGDQSAPQQPGWGQQSAEPAPQQSWDQPAPPQPGWGPSAPQPSGWDDQGASEPQQQSWGDPAPQQSWDRSQGQQGSVPSAETQGWAPPHAQDEQPSQEVPGDLTADAWGTEDDAVDEQTRLTVADDSLGDLEQTRISAVQLPAVKKLRLITDDGAERLVEKPVVVGRNPSATGDEVLFVMKDDTRSVSKTHLRIDGTGEDVTVTDLGSTNGSAIEREDGTRESLVPNTPMVLPTGAKVTLGDRTVSVEREQ